MDIKIEEQNGVTVIAIPCNLDGSTSAEAQDKIFPLVGSSCCLVVDLCNCSYISSAGLRVLLMLAKQVTSEAGRLFLSGVSDEIKDVMEMTGFIGFFKIHDSVNLAIEEAGKTCQ